MAARRLLSWPLNAPSEKAIPFRLHLRARESTQRSFPPSTPHNRSTRYPPPIAPALSHPPPVQPSSTPTARANCTMTRPETPLQHEQHASQPCPVIRSSPN